MLVREDLGMTGKAMGFDAFKTAHTRLAKLSEIVRGRNV